MRRAAWLAGTPPTVAIEIAGRRVAVAGLTSGAATAVSALAVEPLPEGAVLPALSGQNIVHPDAVVSGVTRALQRAGLGGTRRAALVVPDSVARVSLVSLTDVPSRPADLDQIIAWQMRKATPFPLEQAQVTHFEASRSPDATTFAAVVARREVIAEYEAIATAAGIHAGTVDLASFNIMNALMAVPGGSSDDALLVHVTTEATTLAILRGGDLLFYRHRPAVDEEPLGALVHQTAMYHEDRLGGGPFGRVWVTGPGANAAAQREVRGRLGVDVQLVDLRQVVDLAAAGPVGPDTLDAVAASIGILLRERKAA